MNAVVTGATGHLGANLVRVLLAQGIPVRVMVRSESNKIGIERLPVEVVTGDILQPASLNSVLAGCTHLFHAAAVFDFHPHKRNTILETAVTGTKNILEAAIKCSTLQRIVYTSSTAAIGYSRNARSPKTELHWNDDFDSPYVEAKTRAEQLVHEMQLATGLPIVTVNPSVLLGYYDYRLTPSTQMVHRFLMQSLPVTIPGGMSIVDVTDAAVGHFLAAERGIPGERYILTGGNLTIREFYDTTAELTGLSAPSWELGKATGSLAVKAMEAYAKLRRKAPQLTLKRFRSLYQRYGFYDAAKAKSELGFQPTAVRNAIARSIAWLLLANSIPIERVKKMSLQEEVMRYLPNEWEPGKVFQLQSFQGHQ
ncbi:MAG: NAD-dependent epimerase/dehydratase family protein [bacterium]|nr:NAD-dependent epimerase/dehydratase family protein [bacterium]